MNGFVGRLCRIVARNFDWQRRAGEPVSQIVCVSMVKNEQDIIENFVRHNHRFFDLMVVLDNNSSDDTRAILQACSREFDNVVVADQPEVAYRQSEFMTNAIHSIQGVCFSDFVCVLDADEFIQSSTQRDFLNSLKDIPVGECALLPWQTYLPDPAIEVSYDAMVGMTYRRKEERPLFYKAIMRFGGMIDLSATVGQGSHGYTRRDLFGRIKPVKAHIVENVSLMHFPLRSVEQMISKGVNGWKANIANAESVKNSSWAYQWKRIYDLVKERGVNLTREHLSLEAMIYAQNVPCDDFYSNALPSEHGIDLSRKYSDGRYGDCFSPVAGMGNAKNKDVSRFVIARPTCDSDSEMTDVDTAFSSEWHWDKQFVDIPPYKFFVEKLNPRSVLDVGCGSGAALHLMKFLGVKDVYGVDGVPPSSTVLGSDEYAVVDLQKTLECSRQFDLVMCIEVVEHLHPQYTKIALESIARHARDCILFSMGDLGQPGEAHINCKSMRDIIELWSEFGWAPSLNETLAVRSVSTLFWLQRNLLVLRPASHVSSQALKAFDALVAIGNMKYVWLGQQPGIRTAPFKDPSTRYDVGYVERYF